MRMPLSMSMICPQWCASWRLSDLLPNTLNGGTRGEGTVLLVLGFFLFFCFKILCLPWESLLYGKSCLFPFSITIWFKYLQKVKSKKRCVCGLLFQSGNIFILHYSFVFLAVFLHFFQIPVRRDLKSGPLGPYFLSGKHVFSFSLVHTCTWQTEFLREPQNMPMFAILDFELEFETILNRVSTIQCWDVVKPVIIYYQN